MDPVKGAEAKARTSIVKACTNDCPECYAASVCSTGEPVVSNTEAQLDPFGDRLVYRGGRSHAQQGSGEV